MTQRKLKCAEKNTQKNILFHSLTVKNEDNST